MPALQASHAELIATSAAHAAWVGAAASTLASMVALGVAVWSARREEGRRRRLAADEERAFAFGMVGALEMIKPIIIAALAEPDGHIPQRRFVGMVDHARMIADAALAIRVFDMQMLRDGYLLRGLLNGLGALVDAPRDAVVANACVLELVEPVLAGVIDADDRFFERLPALTEVRGIHGRTPIVRPAEGGGAPTAAG